MPPAEPHHDEMAFQVSNAHLERRAMFRRIVAGVVAFAAVVSIFVVGRRVMNRPPSVSQPSPTAQAQTAAPKPTVDAKAEEEAKKKAAEEEAKKKAAEEEAKKKAEEEAKKKAIDFEAYKKKGMKELNNFAFKDAAETGKALIDADPDDASGYFILGAALESMGKAKDGREQYNECVRKAKKGPINECIGNGGRK